MRTASCLPVRNTVRFDAGRPLKRRPTSSSVHPSSTSAMSPTRMMRPSPSALITIWRTRSARSPTPRVRTLVSASRVRSEPPGTSRIHALIASDTAVIASRCRSSASRSTSTRSSARRVPAIAIVPMPGHARRSSSTSRIERLRVSSSVTPKTVSGITGWCGSNSPPRMRSASPGRSCRLSMRFCRSSRRRRTSAPSSNFTTMPPPPSRIVVVMRSTSWMSSTASSIFRARVSSTSCGLAPGYARMMRAASGSRSGKNSRRIVNAL